MAYYKIDHDRGMSVVKAKSVESARSDANKEYGSRSIRSVERATDQDVAWFEGMGGFIYEV